MSILNCDRIRTCRQAAESTARTKGSTIDRVSVRRSSTRACNCHAAGRTAKARDIGLRTYRGPEGCGWLSDRDRLCRCAAVGIFDRDRVGTGSQATERSAVAKGSTVFGKRVGRSSARTRDGYAAGRTTKARDIGL